MLWVNQSKILGRMINGELWGYLDSCGIVEFRDLLGVKGPSMCIMYMVVH